MLGVSTGAQLGTVTVSATNGRGLNADELTAMVMRKLLFVGDEVPEPLRSQALAFREQLTVAVHAGLVQAQRSERTTMAAELERAGMFDAAALVGKI